MTEYEFEVIQDGMLPVYLVEKMRVMTEIMRYARVYGQDGLVKVVQKKPRRRVVLNLRKKTNKFFTVHCPNEKRETPHDRQLVIDRLKYEVSKLSEMTFTNKKNNESILWSHIKEAERRLSLLYDLKGGGNL